MIARKKFEQAIVDALKHQPGVARHDLGLDELWVVKPRGNGYPLEEKIRVAPLAEALKFCDAITAGQK